MSWTVLALALVACGGEDSEPENTQSGELTIDPACDKYEFVFEEPQGEFCPNVDCDCSEDSGINPEDISFSVTQRGYCLVDMNCETACADAIGIPTIFDCVD